MVKARYVKYLSERASSENWWRILSHFWSVVLFAVIIIDFITNNRISDITGPVAAIYTGVLAIYSAEKEFERWNHVRQGKHPGEIYVYIWTAIIFAILIFDFAFSKTYRLPGEILSTYIVVLGILAITTKSKLTYKRKQ